MSRPPGAGGAVDVDVVDGVSCCGNVVDASGTPGQLPPTARFRGMKKGWSNTQGAPVGRLPGVRVR
jgi:hypothetical protein